MAKKKPIINLQTKNIEFTLQKVHYKVLSFNPNSMTLDVLIEDKDGKSNMKDFPFAHAPKEIKKIIKPN